MPIARFEMPDGRIARFEVPEGTSPEQAMAMIQEQLEGEPTIEKGGFYDDMRRSIFPGEEQRTPSQPGTPVLPGAAGAPDPSSPTNQPASTIPSDALAVIGELANSMNRTVTDTIDFLGIEPINIGLRKLGITEIPTAGAALSATPGGEGGFMQPGFARDTVRTLGQGLTAGAGMVPVARNVATAGGAAAELMGFGGARGPLVAGQLPQGGFRVGPGELPPTIPPGSRAPAIDLGSGGPVPAGTKVDETKVALLRGEPENITAGKMLDPSAPIDQPKVITSPTGRAALKVGAPEGIVASMQQANAATKKKMLQALQVLKRGIGNDTWATRNRPSDVQGRSLLDRLEYLEKVRKTTGPKIKTAARDLVGKRVDVSGPTVEFQDGLADMGVRFDRDTNLVTLAKNSDIEGMPKVQKNIQKILARMNKDGIPDAYAYHQMKEWIDGIVEYGKSPKGKYNKNVDNLVKNFRRGIDSALDAKFPEYAKVNQRYSDTRGAIDSLTDIANREFSDAGHKFDLTDARAANDLGTLMRRIPSNARSRDPLISAIDRVDEIANKYSRGADGQLLVGKGRSFDDDLVAQARYMKTLEDMFGSFAPTSFLGDILSGAGQAARGDTMGATQKAGKAAIDFVRRKNPDKAIQALRDLLEEQQ